MDKDRFRQSLGGLIEAYEEVAHRRALSSTNRPPPEDGLIFWRLCCFLW